MQAREEVMGIVTGINPACDQILRDAVVFAVSHEHVYIHVAPGFAVAGKHRWIAILQRPEVVKLGVIETVELGSRSDLGMPTQQVRQQRRAAAAATSHNRNLVAWHHRYRRENCLPPARPALFAWCPEFDRYFSRFCTGLPVPRLLAGHKAGNVF